MGLMLPFGQGGPIRPRPRAIALCAQPIGGRRGSGQRRISRSLPAAAGQRLAPSFPDRPYHRDSHGLTQVGFSKTPAAGCQGEPPMAAIAGLALTPAGPYIRVSTVYRWRPESTRSSGGPPERKSRYSAYINMTETEESRHAIAARLPSIRGMKVVREDASCFPRPRMPTIRIPKTMSPFFPLLLQLVLAVARP